MAAILFETVNEKTFLRCTGTTKIIEAFKKTRIHCTNVFLIFSGALITSHDILIPEKCRDVNEKLKHIILGFETDKLNSAPFSYLIKCIKSNTCKPAPAASLTADDVLSIKVHPHFKHIPLSNNIAIIRLKQPIEGFYNKWKMR